MTFGNKLLSTLSLALVLLLLAPFQASAACVWSISPSSNENPNQFGNGLNAVSDFGGDAWAVGYYKDKGTGSVFPLAERWGGTIWQIIGTPSPSASQFNFGHEGVALPPDTPRDFGYPKVPSSAGSPGTPMTALSYAYLRDVVAITPTNVWAAGVAYSYSTRSYFPFIEHWNGSSWSVTRSPLVSGALYAVKAISANDVWAAGTFYAGGEYKTLLEHWNGATWTVVPSPNVIGFENYLGSLTSTGSNDVWAVGSYQTKTGGNGTGQTLAEHWDGTKWTIVPTPNASSKDYFTGVAAVTPNDVVAVGSYYNPSIRKQRTLGEQWDGSRWTLQNTTSQGQYSTVLNSVAAVSPTKVVAVGEWQPPSGHQTYAERRTAVGWVTTITPFVDSNDSLIGASPIPGTNDVWAVGGTYYRDATGVLQGNKTLVDRYHC